MHQSLSTFLDRLSYGLTALFTLDRLLKLLAARHFFRRPSPPTPVTWPTATLLQPITRGTNNLLDTLRARAHLDYPSAIQHILICDANDEVSQTAVASFLTEFPQLQAQVVLVSTAEIVPRTPPAHPRVPARGTRTMDEAIPSERTLVHGTGTPRGYPGGEDFVEGYPVATKMTKLAAALPHATGEILCFVDDDVTLRSHSLRVLVPYLFEPGVGVAFGLPCFTNWQTVWSSLISGLVNAHMVLSFIALTYLIDPFRINGHIFAFRQDIFQRIGGFHGLEKTIDDEYEIARRVRQHALRAAQTPLIYDIDNALTSWQAYTKQFKRWFVMPRQAMMPSLTPAERGVASISSLTLPIPSLVALLALGTRRAPAILSLGITLVIFGVSYAFCEKHFLQHSMPLRRWLLLPIVALWSPVHILWTLLLGNEVEWRGQRLRLLRNGRVEIVSEM